MYWNRIVCSLTEKTPKTHVIPNNGSKTTKFQTDDLQEINSTLKIGKYDLHQKQYV